MNFLIVDIFYLLGFVVGFCLLLVMAWLLTITLVAAKAIHEKRNVREAIQPLLDEF